MPHDLLRAFTCILGTPLGEYQPSRRRANPSANRWTVRPTVNFSYTPDRGWTWLETYVSAAAFTPNDAFQAGGASRLTQRPLSSSKAMRAVTSPPRIWLSADAYYNAGGEKQASTGCLKAMPPTRCDLAPAWVRALARRRLGAECRVCQLAKPESEPYAWGVTAHLPTILVNECCSRPITMAGR